jgi:hypothetical protein
MIDACMSLGIAGELALDYRTAMRATIDEPFDLAVFVAIENDRGLSQVACSEISRLRNLNFEPNKAPGGASENPL